MSPPPALPSRSHRAKQYNRYIFHANTHRFNFCYRFYRCFLAVFALFHLKKKVFEQLKPLFYALFHVKHLQFYQSKRHLFAIRQTLIMCDVIMYSTSLQYHYVLSYLFYTLFHVKQRFNLMFRLVFSYFRCIFIEKRASKSMFHVKHYDYYRAKQDARYAKPQQKRTVHSHRFLMVAGSFIHLCLSILSLCGLGTGRLSHAIALFLSFGE